MGDDDEYQNVILVPDQEDMVHIHREYRSGREACAAKFGVEEARETAGKLQDAADQVEDR